MDVRCERCRAQYVFDDEQVTPSGLTVQCTNCGHVFKVKKKELVVTVPVKPDELEGTPMPATAAAPKPAGAGAHAAEPERPREAARETPREWRVRQANGNTFTFRELTTLQKWIIEQKVSRDDEISSHSGDQWKRLGNIAELASFFQVVEAAERGKTQGGPAVTPLGMPTVPVYGVALQAPMYPPPGYGPPPYPPPAYAAPPAAEPAPSPLSVEVDLGPDDLAAVRKARGGRGAWILAVLLLLAAAGAAAWKLAPRLLAAKGGAETVAVPITLAAPAPAEPAAPEPAPPAALPVAAPEPVAEEAVEPPPDPIVKPAAKVAAPPAPKGPKALLAQAARLRDRGEVERALDLYGQVVEADPGNVDALTGRGLCYLDLETYPPAEASFEAALGLRPDEPDALLGLAETFRWQGKRADAIRYYERYLAAHPEGEEAAVARNALEELRKQP
jgi:predicted Zn finger-like uncharacterized protein